MAQNISLWGANYSNVPAVNLPKQGGGTAKFTDVSGTTAVETDVASGKIFFKADGSQATGTASGGGGSSSIDTKTLTNSTNTVTSLSFTSMKGQPIAFFVRCTTQMQSSSTTYYYVSNMRYNGTNVNGNAFRMGSTRQVTVVTSGYSYSYSGTTLTISSNGNRTTAPGSFYNGTYELTYIY